MPRCRSGREGVGLCAQAHNPTNVPIPVMWKQTENGGLAVADGGSDLPDAPMPYVARQDVTVGVEHDTFQ